MYCAYTIPGMTGSSLMYYYNGKAVRHSSIPSSLPFLLPPRGFGSQGKTRERERERGREGEREREGSGERERKEKKGEGEGERGGVKVKSVAFTHQLHSASVRRRAAKCERTVSSVSVCRGLFWEKTAALLFIRGNK